MSAVATLERISASGVVMVSRASSPDDALRAVEAARAGGISSIEVTFTVPDAAEVIARLHREGADDLVLGAGTVLTLEQAQAAVDAGARYLVSPGLDEELVEFALEHDVLMLPGVLTPTEIMRAVQLGCEAVKLFPASTVGPDYVRSILAPLPNLQIIPSGGVSSANADQWITAGCAAVGVGGALSPTGELDGDAVASIQDEAAACIAAVTQARATTTRKA